jgi:hypothetical protein
MARYWDEKEISRKPNGKKREDSPSFLLTFPYHPILKFQNMNRSSRVLG